VVYNHRLGKLITSWQERVRKITGSMYEWSNAITDASSETDPGNFAQVNAYDMFNSLYGYVRTSHLASFTHYLRLTDGNSFDFQVSELSAFISSHIASGALTVDQMTPFLGTLTGLAEDRISRVTYDKASLEAAIVAQCPTRTIGALERRLKAAQKELGGDCPLVKTYSIQENPYRAGASTTSPYYIIFDEIVSVLNDGLVKARQKKSNVQEL
jgi:hypothetical protein